MKIEIGNVVQTLLTLKQGIVSKVNDKFISIDFLDGSEGDYVLKDIEKHIRIISQGSKDGVTKVDFKQIRQSKLYVKELETILSILEKQIEELYPHKKYITITESILALKDSKMFLEIHLNKHKRILAEAGIKL